MDRLVRLTQVWSWLPAFRAVAETEHLHQAAALVHLTPSTLSRAVHLLEDALGRPLFRRIGRSLELNDDGRLLLASLREAMRGLDDAIGAVNGSAPRPLRVASDEAIALAAIVDTLPSVPTLPELSLIGDDVSGAILRGSIDVALATAAPVTRELAVERVGLLRWSLYAAHSDVGARVIDAPGCPWPPEVARGRGPRVASLALAAAACRAGAGVGLLPDLAADGLVRVGGVHVCQPVFVLRRCRRAGAAATALVAETDALVAAVRARLEQPVRQMAMDPSAADA